MSTQYTYVERLIVALRSRNFAAADDLLEEARQDPTFDINEKNSSGMTIVHMFAVPDRTEELRWLKSSGADFNIRDKNGQTPAMIAVMSSSPKLVQAVLDCGADAEIPNSKGVTPLLQAVLNHKENGITEILLNAGVNPDPVSETGTTPLLAAASRGRAKLVELLLERGADPEAADNQGIGLLTAAVLAMDSEDGSGAVLKTIQEKSPVPLNPNAPAKSGTTPMAAALGQVEAISVLLDMGSDPNVVITNKFQDGFTIIQSAVGSVEDDLPFKKKEDDNSNSQTPPGKDANRLLVQRLLERGANPNTRNDEGRNAGAFASHNSLLLGDLVAGGLDPSRPMTPFGSTPYDVLADIAKAGKMDVDAAKAWIDRVHGYGFQFDRPAWDVAIEGPKPKEPPRARGEVAPVVQPVLHNLVTANAYELVWHCIGKGANPDVRNENGVSLAHLLVMNADGLTVQEKAAIKLSSRAKNIDKEKADEQMSEILLNAQERLDEIRRTATRCGVKWDSVDTDGNSPLHYAVSLGRMEWARWLINDASVDMTVRNKKGLTPAAVALQSGNAEIAYALIKIAEDKGKDLRKDIIADTVLASQDETRHRASWLHAMTALKEALDFKASDVAPSSRDEDARHPIFLCASTDMDDVCRVLLSLGGDPEARDEAGNTALMAAMFSENGEIVRQLRAMGASPNTKNNAGQSAVDVADWKKSVYLHNMLRDNNGLDDLREEITGSALLGKMDDVQRAEMDEDKQWFRDRLQLHVDYFFGTKEIKDINDHEWNRPASVRQREKIMAAQQEAMEKIKQGGGTTAETMTPENIGSAKKNSP